MKVGVLPTAICNLAPCTQSMPCIGHFAGWGDSWQEAVTTSRKNVHLFSPFFVWLEVDFCNFFQLIPSCPYEKECPNHTWIFSLASSLHFLGWANVPVSDKRLTFRTNFDIQTATLCKRNILNEDSSLRKTNKTVPSSWSVWKHKCRHEDSRKRSRAIMADEHITVCSSRLAPGSLENIYFGILHDRLHDR